MCMQGPPYGIPVTQEIHDRYSLELQHAWMVFDLWWKEEWDQADGERKIRRSTMSEDVRNAYELIKKTPIPGYEADGLTGKDSCYLVFVESQLVD